MTLIVLASDHLVRYVFWVQVAIFTKWIGILCGLNFFAFNIFCEEYLQPCPNTVKMTVREVPINNYELLNIQDCSFLTFSNMDCTQSVMVSSKYEDSRHINQPPGGSGPRFNIKMSYQYRKYHCGDKTVVRLSYLHNGISFTGKTYLYKYVVLPV